MAPQTIVVVSDTVYPYFKGGKEKRIFEITTRMARMGYNVHIYTMKWWDGPRDIIENDVHLHGIGSLHRVYADANGRRSIKASLLFALACLKLVKVDFDIIDVDHMPYLQLFSVWLVCKLKRKKLFATWHEVWTRKYWTEYMGVFGIIGYFIERVSAVLPDYIIAVSGLTHQRLAQRHPRKAKRLVTAYSGLDLSDILRIAPAADHYDIMFAGRLLQHKRVDMLIQAVKVLKDQGHFISCAIAGDGPQKDNLQQLARDLGVARNIHFTGFIPDHRDVLALMKSSRVFVLPSEREGFGLVVIEANACGVPAITYNYAHNAARDLIRDGVNGFLFDSPQDLADKISHCLAQPPKPADYYQETIQQFDWQVTVQSVLEAYTQ